MNKSKKNKKKKRKEDENKSFTESKPRNNRKQMKI